MKYLLDMNYSTLLKGAKAFEERNLNKVEDYATDVCTFGNTISIQVYDAIRYSVQREMTLITFMQPI